MFEDIIRFRKQLDSGEVVLGCGITLADPAVTEALAGSVDFFWIDLEHTHLGYETLMTHLIAARAASRPALVRVRGSDVSLIKPVLDMGAEGIIVPQVRSADEVRQVVANCRYMPEGNRGFGPRRAARYGREDTAAYLAAANRNLFVAIQIENRSALAELDDIAAIEGLDSIALGPADLSFSLGKMGQFDDPEVSAAIERIITTARSAGKSVGTGMGADPELAQQMAKRGVQWIQCGDDYSYMIQQADTLFSTIRRQLPS